MERLTNYRLQIRCKLNGDLFWFKTWDINEPFESLLLCEKMAEDLLDDSVDSMRIVNIETSRIIKQYK